MLLERNCNSCYFSDLCLNGCICDLYYPVEDDTENLIEENRNEFHEFWFKYISEFE